MFETPARVGCHTRRSLRSVSEPTMRIEVAGGELPGTDLARARRLVADRGGAEVAGARLPEDVVCVARDGDGTVLGLSTAVPADVELVGSQRFLVYGSVLAEAATEVADALLSATFAALDAAFEGAPASAIGLCLLQGDRTELERRPEAHWEEPPMLYAGYLDDGRQVRIGYFAGARIAGDQPGG